MHALIEQYRGVFRVAHPEHLGPGQPRQRDFTRRGLPGPRMSLFPAELSPIGGWIERRSAIVADPGKCTCVLSRHVGARSLKGSEQKMCLADAFRYPQRYAWLTRRSSSLPAMRLGRALHVLLGIGAEHLIGNALLLIGHRLVELLERRKQLLDPLSVLLGDLLIGLHVLHRVHRRELLSALHERLVHVAGVLAHDLRKFVPLRLF